MFLALCKCYVLAAQTKLSTSHNVTCDFMIVTPDGALFLLTCAVPIVLAWASEVWTTGDHAP
jgi:hypothetical protein